MKRLIIAISLIFFLGSIQGQKDFFLIDQVIMITGDVYKGKIVDSTLDAISFIPENGEEVEIPKSEIQKYYQHFDDDDTFIWINREKDNNNIPIKRFKIDTSSKKKITEFGLNLTGLISQFVPFGRSSTANGPYSFTFRMGKGKNLFHAQLGLNINVDENDPFSDTGHFNIAIGYMRKAAVNEKFNYYGTFDLMGFGGSFNDPGSTVNSIDNTGGGGLGLGFGLEYELYKNILIGTEAILYLGSPEIDFISPVGVYLIAHFER